MIKELPKPSTSVLDASPVFSQKAKPRVEEVKEKVRNGAIFKFSDNKLLLHNRGLTGLRIFEFAQRVLLVLDNRLLVNNLSQLPKVSI